MKITQVLKEAKRMNSIVPSTLYRYMSEDELLEMLNGSWGYFVSWDEEVDGADEETMNCILQKNGDHSGQYFKSLYTDPNLEGDEAEDFSRRGLRIFSSLQNCRTS